MRFVVPERQCPKELNGWDEVTDMPWLPCLGEIGHTGFHHSVCDVPCKSCGGIDFHYENCPTPEERNLLYRIMVIEFDDSGTYWCTRVY